MRPVDQTIFVNDPRGIPGDCLRAAVASIWDKPLEGVPHFVLYDDWHTALRDWLADRDAQIDMVWNSRGYEKPMPDRPLLAFGMSPRGVSHAVVWVNGKGVVHDPHPSRDGFGENGPDELWDVLPAKDALTAERRQTMRGIANAINAGHERGRASISGTEAREPSVEASVPVPDTSGARPGGES